MQQQYTCPMHPEVIKNAPGNCPKCGMELVPIEPDHQLKHDPHRPSGRHNEAAQGTPGHEHHQHDTGHDMHGGKIVYDKHAGHHTQDFLKRFWVCLVLTLPILLLSHMIQQWLGFEFTFAGDRYVLLLLSTFVYVYGGMPFLKGMITEIRANAIGMMTLVAIAITVAYIYSAAVVFGLPGMDFFWELATLIDIMLLGHWLEMRSQAAASGALQNLVALLPATVHVNRNGLVEDISLRELRNGDTVLVKPGEKIPADGIVIEGSSYINESMLTGESVPVKKGKQDAVIGGSINSDGALTVKVTGAGEDSYLNKVIDLVSSAQASKSKTQTLADKVAKWLTFISITVGIITFIYWFMRENEMAFALERMVTVMVTACPHALGVAIPLVVAISTSLSATNGLLIRNRPAFESARKISTIIFDKTGTLTKGAHEVQKIIPLDGNQEHDVLQYAASVQQNSEHHLAHGIVRKAQEKNVHLLPVKDFSFIPGVGVKGLVDGREVVSAGPNYFKQTATLQPEIPPEIDQETETVNFLLIDGRPTALFTLADSLRASSKAAISELKEMGIKTYLLTGDNERVAASVARELSMDGYMANVLPHEKQERVKILQAKSGLVAMTGDGVNDAPALAQADVGIAIGSGTDVASETADIILVNSDPADVVKMIRFARATYQKMIQNLAWAVGYNVIAIPLAAGVLYPAFTLSPAMGSVLMSLSTIIVAINAQQLKSNFKKSAQRDRR